MIVKFTQHTDRVKGTSFHPKRPWILTALYSGIISLYDYRLQQVIDKYEGHNGPVRTVQFHPRLSLFVSGGDDTTVRVWNYNTKKEVFLLKGHLDYVRCVCFHPEQPWVISSSDDQTARVWNYQSRQMIAILTGHSNYVMQCQFHPDPAKELIVTCSLDLTARLWSYAPLRQKYSGNKNKSDLPVSGAEITLIAVMSGHKDQMNWCNFHPRQDLIVTSADDKKIILWKYTDTKCTLFETISGHQGNVNCAVFHPKEEVIISNSDDKTTKVWDLKTCQEIMSYQNKDQDRFWIVSAHQDNYYFSCGSDTSLFLFTLYPDRIPTVLVNDKYLCIGQKKIVKVVDLISNQSTVIKDLSSHTSNVSANLLKDNIVDIQYNTYNTAQTQLLLQLQSETKDSVTKFALLQWDPRNFQKMDINFISGREAIFIGRSKLLVLRHDRVVCQLNVEQSDQYTPLIEKAESIFPAPGGKAFIIDDQLLQIYDPITRKTIVSVENLLAKVKQVVWSTNLVAVVGRKTLTILTKNLTNVCSVEERQKIKSAIWVTGGSDDWNQLLVYSTKAQLKYLVLNGETGVIKSTEQIYYLAKVSVTKLPIYAFIGIDNLGTVFNEPLDLSEALFKQALFEKNTDYIQHAMTSQKHLGDSMVSYLFKKNHSSLAMNLVVDKKGIKSMKRPARFQLAISSSNLEVAFRMCSELKEQSCYRELGAEALRQGNHQIVELCYKKLQQIQKLSFLYAILGDYEKQLFIQQTAIETGDQNTRFQAGIFLDDSHGRIKQLAETGQFSLAYCSALIHGYKDEATEIQPLINMENVQASFKYLKTLKPAPLELLEPVTQVSNFVWPHNAINNDQLITLQGTNDLFKLEDEINKLNNQSDVLIGVVPLSKKEKISEPEGPEGLDEDGEVQWGLEEEIELDDETPQAPKRQSEPESIKLDETALKHGIAENTLKKAYSSQVASIQFIVGNIEGGLQTLRKQIALEDSRPLMPYLIQSTQSTVQMISHIPYLNSTSQFILDAQTKRPLNSINTIAAIRQLVKAGHKFTTEGKFTETLNIFQQIIHRVPLVTVSSKIEQEEIFNIVEMSKNYILAMKCELAKKKVGDDQSRILELGCYMTLCNLLPAHKSLTLRSSMSLAYKHKNYLLASILADKLLEVLKTAPEGAPWAKPEVASNAQKILKSCEQQATNQMNIHFEGSWLYNDKIINRLSAESLTIINEYHLKLTIRDQVIFSPYVNAAYERSQQGKICSISGMCKIGQETPGLRLYE